MNRLAERLKESLLIFDGAMGTELYKRNFFVNACYEQLSVTNPSVITDIHKSYLDAGAEVLTTNTFNANYSKLSHFGLGDQVENLNRASVNLARSAAEKFAAGRGILVAGSAGPLGEFSRDAAGRSSADVLAEQVRALSDADFILFESLRSLNDLETALAAAKATELPYVLSFALDRNGEGTGGVTMDVFLSSISAYDGTAPAALGLNCGSGPESTLGALENLVGKTALPLIVQPNAGEPKTVDGRMIYMTSAEYFTTYARRYTQLGAAAVGGCCGISPVHIAELSRSLKPLLKAETHHELPVAEVPQIELEDPIPLAERSLLGQKLARKEFIRTIEITPPRGFDLAATLAGAKRCKEFGIDAVNLPDGPRASARISPLITAVEIYEKTGIEPLLHCCCRDKSLIGLQADILGCACKKIHNILFITGDPPKLGDYPFSSGVFDADSIGMVKIQSRMNRGIDLGGKKLNARTSAVIGVGADPSAIDPEREYRRLCEKVEAGADFIVTQPVFSPEALLKFLKKIEHLHTPVIAGIWPLTSLRNAEFMRNEVPGVVVPDSVMARMAAAATKEEQKAAGIEIARESLAAVRSAIQGVQVSAPFGNVETALAVLR